MDWRETIATAGDDDERAAVVNRIAVTVGDTWAKEWMLSHLAKHLHEELEMRCLEGPAAQGIERIEYGDDGMLRTWTKRKNAHELR